MATAVTATAAHPRPLAGLETQPQRPHSVRPLPLAGLRHLGPNWYAPVMGTAIVGTAGAGLPGADGIPGLRTVCTAVWALSLALLLALLCARALHWVHHRDQARAHLLDPSTAPFYGCLAMALTAVGGGALVVGRDWIGVPAAVALDAILFTAGTLVGLVAAVAVPCLLVVRGGTPSPVWLLPVVAPMVSAALGPLLVPHLPPGQGQRTLLIACLAMFGTSLLATLVMLPVVVARLLTSGPLPLALTPTLFLALGPLGQSTTAAGNFADLAPGVVPAPHATAAGAAVLYGVPVMGFALLWLALAGVLVLRARRRGMGFAMTWWAFTFPVGTCATGAAGLARHTGIAVFGVLAVALYVLLVAAWAGATVRTVRGVVSGELLAGPRPAPAAPRPVTARTR
ncbi:TDT family transporter [Streptomyces sp. ME02-8801-2C]|uniref:TDT family transporter n=1 Tax=Streptomyces sp. ME02-8801-2C TaxID=3028680 RepID=UPI0029AD56F1|nr:TDT family transporter [Streptomyces sp. ME02-8801-2C]MDX3454999.1 TDT family transporter [Streptomyces sp. ME02-8801-2C]